MKTTGIARPNDPWRKVIAIGFANALYQVLMVGIKAPPLVMGIGFLASMIMVMLLDRRESSRILYILFSNALGFIGYITGLIIF